MKPAKELGRLDAARGLLRASSRPSRGGEVHVCARSTPCAPRGPLGRNRPPRACPFGHSRSIHLGGDTGSAKEVLAACPCHPTDGWRPEGLRVSRWSGPTQASRPLPAAESPPARPPSQPIGPPPELWASSQPTPSPGPSPPLDRPPPPPGEVPLLSLAFGGYHIQRKTAELGRLGAAGGLLDRKSTRLNSNH